MPLKPGIRKVMVIGSGPIVIGQAAEFDYAGNQACKALKEKGLEVVLINSNPATLMTDHAMADEIYIEPLTLETVQRIIEKEKPDSLLSTLGGQTGLTLSMELAKSGFLAKHNVQLLGANPETIDKAEDRQGFKDCLESINQPSIPSEVHTDLQAAIKYAEEVLEYPVIIRPAFTLGGTGGGIAYNHDEMVEIASNGLHRSPIHQILVEKCISGWKEIEFEIMRDSAGNCIPICPMENIDPVGVHTGDSIVMAPTASLNQEEYDMLKNAAVDIVNALGVEGGCNVQFALKPNSKDYAVIEVNPRVSRSSALASKASGYPIARVATLIAIGYTIPEITKSNPDGSVFQPSVNYVVVKFPRFPFDKFVYAKRDLGTQMKATGEVMSIGHNFEEAMMKAMRGAEIGVNSLRLKIFEDESDADIRRRIGEQTDQRIFAVYEALYRGCMTHEEIYNICKIDWWFLDKFQNIANYERKLAEIKKSNGELTLEFYKELKDAGFPDKLIQDVSGVKITGALGELKSAEEAAKLVKEGKLAHVTSSYKLVSTCTGRFESDSPYFYSAYDCKNEAEEYLKNLKKRSSKGTIVVLGSGPIRIGQGIEFDYASVQCVWNLKNLGYEVAIINNNPETVSTDFDTADRLYFEPLTPEDVMNVINTEKPIGVVVAFGGQTAIKLTKFLDNQRIPILGTSADSIDLAEDRERFEELCEKLNINRPKGETVMNTEEALDATSRLGYPVLLRPSYVLGGQNMIVAFNDDDVKEYMKIILAQGIENPVLLDQYMMGTELEVDGICDGEDVLIPGIMEHIERTGVHSGDSIAVYPSWNLNDVLREKIIKQSTDLALKLGTKGLVNIQYLIYNNDLFIIEVNPRSSRTVPYISKVTGVPMVELATRAMLGEKIRDMGYGTGLYKIPPYYAVKVPVFSFEKLMDVDTHLGPEMKSTGEVLGLASTREEAIFKGLIAAGYTMKRSGGVLFSVRKTDRYELPELARKFYEMGFKLYATEGNAKTIQDFGMEVEVVNKIHENPEDNLLTLLDSGKVDYVISTSAKGRDPHADSVKMRRHAVEKDIPCLTSLDTANAIADCLMSKYDVNNVELVNINDLRTTRQKVHFYKMECTGNDFILIDTAEQPINNPEGLAVRLCNRRDSIGADSLIIVEKSRKADAKMRFFNQDGSEGKAAGNAIRAVAKYLYDNNVYGVADKHSRITDPTAIISVETAVGIKKLVLYKLEGKVSSVTVEMGNPIFEPTQIPTTLETTQNGAIVNAPLDVDGMSYNATCVNIGNPHCVVFSSFVDKVDVEKIGPIFEKHEVFPERTNTEFVRVVGPNELKMRTWERGNGETPACGTGACAAVVASVLNGFCKKDEEITVSVRGGKLSVKYTDNGIFLTGNTKELYNGTVEI